MSYRSTSTLPATFFKETATRLADSRTLNARQRMRLLEDALDSCALPHPAPEIKSFFAHPNILHELFTSIYNRLPDLHKMGEEYHPYLNTIRRAVGKHRRSETSVNIRVLGINGVYPNIPISCPDAKYVIHNQYPLIICKQRNYKSVWENASIINWLSRNELRFITSMVCASDSALLHFHFDATNSLAVDFDCLRDVPSTLRTHFLFELFSLNRRLTVVGKSPFDRLPLPDIADYEYASFDKYIGHFRTLYKAFPIGNDLLLRTCNYHAKAMMAWSNRIFAEEAIVLNFHCIEGCLHLIQSIYGEDTGKLNLELVREVFVSEIERGENLFDYIKEGYDKRISLVHANPKWGADWSPFLDGADFWDYFKLSRQLLNFILIERHVDFS